VDEHIFPEAVDRAAFFDRIVVSVDGEPRSHPKHGVVIRRRSILAASNYSHVNEYRFASIPNIVYTKYAPIRAFIPKFVLTFHSSEQPLLKEHVESVLEGLFYKEWSATVSEVEFTCDVRCKSAKKLNSVLFTRARRFRKRSDSRGAETYYYGGPSSPWQLRVYDKCQDIVRVEFVLRRDFLRSVGINSLAELEKVRQFNFHKLAWVRRLNTELVTALLASEADVRRRAVAGMLRVIPTARKRVALLHKHFGVSSIYLVRPHSLNSRLGRMRRAAKW
jgi:hypothetical protein